MKILIATTNRGKMVELVAMVGDIEKLCDELGEKDAEVAELERAVVKHKANYEAANNESCEILKSEEKFRIKVTELVEALEDINTLPSWRMDEAGSIVSFALTKFKGGGE